MYQNLCAVLQGKSVELPENGPLSPRETDWRGPQSKKTVQKIVSQQQKQWKQP